MGRDYRISNFIRLGAVACNEFTCLTYPPGDRSCDHTERNLQRCVLLVALEASVDDSEACLLFRGHNVKRRFISLSGALVGSRNNFTSGYNCFAYFL